MTRLIRKAAEVRVSQGAALELGVVLEDYLTRLSKEALKISEGRGAKTLSKNDIKEAVIAVPK